MNVHDTTSLPSDDTRQLIEGESGFNLYVDGDHIYMIDSDNAHYELDHSLGDWWNDPEPLDTNGWELR